MLLGISFWLLGLAVGDQLLQVNVLYRHGDRVPIYSFKGDPNVNKWPLPAGQLTVEGMGQQFLQGQRLQQRYISQLRFVNGSYDPTELYARSADTPRCLQSAGSNLAAFYSGSVVKPSVSGWPSNWMPYPIHTVPGNTDTLCEEGSTSCARISLLEQRRMKDPVYLQFFIKNADFLQQLSNWTGGQINDLYSVNHLWDTLYCQRAHNFTMPAWLTNDVWSRLNDMFVLADDYVEGYGGVPQIGGAENKELVSLKSGELLKQLISSMNDVVNGRNHWKFHVYSAHDSTVKALLRIYHNVYEVLGVNNPGYASHLAHELWQDSDGTFYIKVLFSGDAYSEFKDVTATVNGCAAFADKCPYAAFVQANSQYILADFWGTCNKTT